MTHPYNTQKKKMKKKRLKNLTGKLRVEAKSWKRKGERRRASV
jgi:hypothetical protein